MKYLEALNQIKPRYMAGEIQEPTRHQLANKTAYLAILQKLLPYLFDAYETLFLFEETKGPARITMLGEMNHPAARVVYLNNPNNYEWICIDKEGNLTAYDEPRKFQEVEERP